MFLGGVISSDMVLGVYNSLFSWLGAYNLDSDSAKSQACFLFFAGAGGGGGGGGGIHNLSSDSANSDVDLPLLGPVGGGGDGGGDSDGEGDSGGDSDNTIAGFLLLGDGSVTSGGSCDWIVSKRFISTESKHLDVLGGIDSITLDKGL